MAQQQITWPAWADIAQLIAKNPNREKALSVNPLSGGGTAGNLSITPPGSAADWQEYTIQPAGHLSAIMYCKDPFFADAAPGLRQQMMLAASTDIPQEIDVRIRTTGWARYRKKALEWLGSPPGKLSAEESRQLWDILATVFDIQCIVLGDEEGRVVRAAPADMRSWRADRPLVLIDIGLTRVWTCIRWNGAALLEWLQGRQVEWPEAEGSKVELVEAWEKQPAYKESDRKLKKDDLAKMVGRAQALAALAGLVVRNQ